MSHPGIVPKIEGNFGRETGSEMWLFLPMPHVKMVFSNMKNKRKLEEVLQSASEVMFPHLENHKIDAASVASDGDTPVHIAAVWGDKYAKVTFSISPTILVRRVPSNSNSPTCLDYVLTSF